MLISKDNEISENKQDNQTAVNIFSESFVTIVRSGFVALLAALPCSTSDSASMQPGQPKAVI